MMLLFDPATARDVLDALRLLEGRLISTSRRLSAGAVELRTVAEVSLRSPTVGLSPAPGSGSQDGDVDPYLMTLDEVKHRLHVGLTTVKTAISAGQLRAVHVGRLVRVHSEDLATCMDHLRKENEAA